MGQKPLRMISSHWCLTMTQRRRGKFCSSPGRFGQKPLGASGNTSARALMLVFRGVETVLGPRALVSVLVATQLMLWMMVLAL
eukprot:3186588-Alexandrium_andersonii.AAC.1